MISIVKTSARFLWLSLQQMTRQSSAPCFIAMVNYQPVDIKSRWRHNWKSAQVDNSHLVCDPTIWQPGFNLPRQQWSLLNRFHIEQGHCSACRRKWRLTDTDLSLWQDPDDVPHCQILTSYGSWHALLLLFIHYVIRQHIKHTKHIKIARPKQKSST